VYSHSLKMENINLASDKLGTTICCDSVSNEDYPCQNLLQAGDEGFMVDYFIRPPVTLTVHLPLPVVLSSISWDTTLGSQSSSLHTVSTATKVALGGRECTSVSCKLSSDNFFQVGRGVGEKGTITFFNRSVVVTQDGLRLGCKDNRGALTGVTAVRLTILRTDRNSVPCIRNLRIFGVSTGRPEVAQLEQELIRKSEQQGKDRGGTLNFFGGENSGSLQTSEVTLTDAGESERQLKDQEPPAEFLDSITHCLMQLPMTLPSGHHVDRSTLDRCRDSFAAWGGQPRDPFTGKLFSERVRPVFNAGLKSRIDSFLLNSENREDFRSAGRTLGSAQMIQEFLLNKGKKRRFPCYDENISDSSSDKVIKLDSTDDELDTSDLDTALFKTLNRSKYDAK